MYLEKIQQANDIKNLENDELQPLAEEIRQFLIAHVAEHGGHLASNLGAVELTMALHLTFDPTVDQMIWDVGHQCYTHKILTGRKEGFQSLREYQGMSGFPKRKESICDSFDTGHSSTSISAGVGMAVARDLLGKDYKVISIIGDGAMTGGMAYEAMNNAAKLEKNFIIVLNDNEMSISQNVGGMSKYLESIRTSGSYQHLKDDVLDSLERVPVYGKGIVNRIRKTKSSIKQLFIPGMLFENMGLTYLGPVNGHDIAAMRKVFSHAARVNGPVIVHVITKKGKGYLPAERHPARFHGTAAFDIETGDLLQVKEKADYTDVFSSVINKLAAKNERIVAITAAMESGTGLKKFHKNFPDRFFDVGIAEEHAVSFAAGMAAQGLIPVFAVYSSFLQRAYDQILHDVCLQNLHVIFCVDRAGFVGNDGETHQGIFDLSYLLNIPNLIVLAPKNCWELADMMQFAVNTEGPVVIRYPKGTAFDQLKEKRQPIRLGEAEMICEESQIGLISYGSMMPTALEVREKLKQQGFACSICNARFAKPLDRKMLDQMAASHRLLVTMEENELAGGFGQQVATYLDAKRSDTDILHIAVEDTFVPQGSIEDQRKLTGMDAEQIVTKILDRMKA